jgi:hypothetical protein
MNRKYSLGLFRTLCSEPIVKKLCAEDLCYAFDYERMSVTFSVISFKNRGTRWLAVRPVRLWHVCFLGTGRICDVTAFALFDQGLAAAG